MLNLESAVQLEGVTLYQDFSDPNLYYYMPDNPELARQHGEPLFQLLLYREQIADDPGFQQGQDRGGGFLTMTVDLKVSQSKLETIKRSLPGGGGEIKLVPVPFESGKVRITARSDAGEIFELVTTVRAGAPGATQTIVVPRA